MKPDSILKNWATLNAVLQDLSEKECEELLTNERNGQRRLQFLLRLYGRYNKLRSQRERNTLIKAAQL